MKISKTWNSSKKPGKQRKFRYKAPLHLKKKFVSSHLSSDLRKKHRKRSIGLRTGDKVKVMRGNFSKKEGKVEKIDIKKSKVFVSGIEITKKDGSKQQVSINPSNLVITELNLDDKKRQKSLERKNK